MDTGSPPADDDEPRSAEGAALVDVFVDGSVCHGDWAAVAWFVSPERWGAVAYREPNSTVVEADAVALAVHAVAGPVRVHSDCGAVVDGFGDLRTVVEFAWSSRGRWRILSAMDAAWDSAADRPVEVVHVPAHCGESPPGNRLVDAACRYAIVRLAAASAGDHLSLGPDDLPRLRFLAAEGYPVDEAFRIAAGDRLYELGIFDEYDSAHPDPFVDWRMGALRALAPLAVRPARGRPPFPWLPEAWS